MSDRPTGNGALAWLLEESDPGVRYLALRDLVGLPPSDPELAAARAAAHRAGPIAEVVAAMNGAGFWVKPGPGYLPKYRATVWSVLLLAQLGASAAEDPRIGRACAYVLDHALADGGRFSSTGAPSGTVDCLQGNLCWALLTLGCDDPRLDEAVEWMARTVTGEGVAPNTDRRAPVRYYAGKCGPDFACGANNRLPCAWGATKVMLAFSAWSPARWTPLIERAIERGVSFLLANDPADAEYPTGYSARPSGNWWKFGFPVFYVTDVLQIVEAMVALGRGGDPRLAGAWSLVREKGGPAGRWALEYHYTGKTWTDFGSPKAPSKWVTLRALRALRSA